MTESQTRIYTSAFKKFMSRMKEIDELCILVNSLSSNGKDYDQSQIESICRGAIVLLGGKVELYFEELGILFLDKLKQSNVDMRKFPDRLVYHILIDKIKNVIDSSEAYLNNNKNNKYKNKLNTFFNDIKKIEIDERNNLKINTLNFEIDNFTRKRRMPKFDDIASYFNRFGFKDFKQEYFKQTQHEELHENYNEAIQKRHDIAHGNDEISISPTELIGYNKNVYEFCKIVDIVFSNWYENEFGEEISTDSGNFD